MKNPKILQDVRLIQKCIIVRKDGKILALKRAADDHSRGGNWDLPGGGYEEGRGRINHQFCPASFLHQQNWGKRGVFPGGNRLWHVLCLLRLVWRCHAIR